MNEEIGRKIKEIRRTLGMTQTQLAGPEMTKSMLSHIENGKANPSMKNLQYIALKLNKPISYFLEENDFVEELNIEENLPINFILDTLKRLDSLMADKKFKAAKDSLMNLLESYEFNEEKKLYADLLFRLGTCCVNLKEFEKGEENLKLSSDIYVKNRLFIEAARANLTLLARPIENYKYNVCADIIKKSYELYNQSSSRDVFLELELLNAQPYNIMLAQGEFEKAIEVCEKSIALSEENNIYYYSDRAYRTIAIINFLRNDFKKFILNMDKAKKYAEFINDKYLIARISQNYAMYENMMKNPLKALEYFKVYEENTEERAFYYYLELSRANYLLGNYEEALRYIDKINYKEKIKYLIDCIYILTAKILHGLIFSKLKEYDKAIFYIEEAIEAIKTYTSIEYKGFVDYAYKELTIAYKSLSEVYFLNEDYEKAYGFLKKSYDLKNI